MAPIEVQQLTQRFGSRMVLRDLDLTVPDGALYALLGRNGAGKTTLFHILLGLRRATSGMSRVLGVPSEKLTERERARIGYVAEGQSLPGWMTLEQLEAYLRPLYVGWDNALATSLRRRFELRPDSTIKTMSRGEQMKTALLCALAPRPQLLVMDEPFTGMDAVVKDELVGGLLDSARTEGWTVVISSHDISELEMLADWVGILDDGKIQLSSSTEQAKASFRRVELVLPEAASQLPPTSELFLLERAGSRVRFIGKEGEPLKWFLSQLPAGTQVTTREPTLKEIFVATTRKDDSEVREQAA